MAVGEGSPSSKGLHVQQMVVQRNWAADMGSKKENHKVKVGMEHKEGDEMKLVLKWLELEWLEYYQIRPPPCSMTLIFQAFSQHAEQRKDSSQLGCWLLLLTPYAE